MNTFDGDIYEKLFGKKNNAVINSNTSMDYKNTAKKDISSLYDNSYMSPTCSMNKPVTNIQNSISGTTNGMTNGISDATNGMMNICMDDMSAMTNVPLTPFPEQTPLAMAYIPFQQWEKTYDESKALSRGTLFPSLDKPFIGKGAVNNGSK